ncbi:MAG: hypothetical protein AAFZ52_14095, partial [Bacteroidota bacterium]
MRTFLLSVLCIWILSPSTCVRAQTSGQERQDAYQQRQNLQKNSLAAGLEFVNIGPTIMSGRVSDIAVDPADPTHFYVAYA